MSTSLLTFYRFPGLSDSVRDSLVEKHPEISTLETEICYYTELGNGVDVTTYEKSTKKGATLRWLLSETFEPSMCVQGLSHFATTASSSTTTEAACCAREQELLTRTSGIQSNTDVSIVEVGPRLSFTSAFSTNAVSICRACGLGDDVTRVEKAIRYRVQWATGTDVAVAETKFAALVHDRMTQMIYATPLDTFGIPPEPEPTKTIPVMAEGQAALARASEEKGLAFDAWDLEFYTKLFAEEMKRDPTEVEIFDMAQSNSEHSRHWFFGGKMVIDGIEKPQTLFRMVKDTLIKGEDDNSIIAFHDNSSVIRGYPVRRLCPTNQSGAGPLVETDQAFMHPLLTAETHNFPSGVAPFPGATTGTGGRIRDVQATGTGAHTVAGTAAYCVGNLNIPGHNLPWEDKSFEYPSNLASPLSIIVEASNGASDYGNKFGEPVVTGYARSYGKFFSFSSFFSFIVLLFIFFCFVVIT